ncbi:MAG: tRNA threonylcarbamoyladenosine dehydratase [Alistipes sp.]|nr:tRNA threonylcarbamoyladenosine dehydratase [Alistipes sp.]
MQERFIRTEMLLGSGNMAKLKKSHVIVFGVGGVGGYVVEALARSGVGELTLVDDDVVAESNLNRQIIATTKTLGMAKVDAAKERVLAINPDAAVNACRMFYLPQTAGQFDFTRYDYVVDAIDTVSGKIALVLEAKRCGVPVISSMGAGNKLNPAAFEVADIYETSVCPLAKVMRRELKKRGVKELKVVYSKEEPLKPLEESVLTGEDLPGGTNGENGAARKRQTPGSVAFVPSVAGLIIAGEVVKDLTGF